MKCFALISVLLIPIVISQNVDFGDSDETPVEGEDVNTKTGTKVGEDDVNTRFFNVDLNTFAGQVAASALGTVVGNAGVNLAGNLLANCNNRGKRSILMHKLEKRQALEASEKTGNVDGDQEVATRLICPQDLLGQSGGNNGRYCDRCYCSDWDCRRDCRKCSYGNNNANGWSSGGSSSSNNNWGQSSSNHVNCNSCYCSTSSSCRNTCRKCVSNNNANGWSSSSSSSYPSSSSTTVTSCSSCYCSSSSWCRSKCSKCRNNNSGWSNNNGGSYNNGWRSSNSVKGRDGVNLEEEEVVTSQDNSEQKSNTDEESVVFA